MPIPNAKGPTGTLGGFLYPRLRKAELVFGEKAQSSALCAASERVCCHLVPKLQI